MQLLDDSLFSGEDPDGLDDPAGTQDVWTDGLAGDYEFHFDDDDEEESEDEDDDDEEEEDDDDDDDIFGFSEEEGDD